MKKIFNILIIFFIISSLYYTREDLSSLYQNIKSDVTSSLEDEESLDELEFVDIESEAPKEQTPGALKVINSVFSNNASKVNLTKAGIIYWTNKYRNEIQNLPALKENQYLNIAAKKKLDDIFSNNYFEHVSPSGVGVGDLGKEAGYDFILIGENLALGNFKDDEAVTDAWMESPGHRANILNSNYADIGIAVGSGMFDGNEVWIAVQHFGLPKSACPQTSQELKEEINANQEKINKMQKELSQMDKDIKSKEGSEKSKLIKEYNLLVSKYNDLLNKTKKDIEKFNLQVKNFNSCISNTSN